MVSDTVQYEKYYRPNLMGFFKKRWKEILSLLINTTAMILILTRVLIFYYGIIIIVSTLIVHCLSIARRRRTLKSQYNNF